MATNRNLYAILGVTSRATPEEIRSAYRTLARQLHPDVAGATPGAAGRMAEVNHAWSVLSDPAARYEYDALQRAHQRNDGSAVPPSRDGVRTTTVPRQIVPPRFPWRAMLFVAAAAALVVLVAHAFTEPAVPGVPDQLIQAGSCVQIDRQGFAVEVACDGPHDGVVTSFVAIDQTCPAVTRPHLDRQGMGKACVEEAPAK